MAKKLKPNEPNRETFTVRPPAPQGENTFCVVEAIPRDDWKGRFVCRTNAELENWQSRLLAEANHRCMNGLAKLLFERFAKAPKQDPLTGDYRVEIRVMLTDRNESAVFNEGRDMGMRVASAAARAAVPYGLDDFYE